MILWSSTACTLCGRHRVDYDLDPDLCIPCYRHMLFQQELEDGFALMTGLDADWAHTAETMQPRGAK